MSINPNEARMPPLTVRQFQLSKEPPTKYLIMVESGDKACQTTVKANWSLMIICTVPELGSYQNSAVTLRQGCKIQQYTIHWATQLHHYTCSFLFYPIALLHQRYLHLFGKNALGPTVIFPLKLKVKIKRRQNNESVMLVGCG